MSKHKTIENQIHSRLSEMTRFGQKKYLARIDEGTHNPEGIFGTETYKKYLSFCKTFAGWLKINHPEVRKLDDAGQYVPEYLEVQISDGKSAWTIRAYASALAKLFHCSSNDFGVGLPERKRADIKRDREAPDEKTIEKYKDVIDFCTGTGLRAKELRLVCPEDIFRDKSGALMVTVKRGKGGKRRVSQVLKEYESRVLELAGRKSKGERIFDNVPADARLHYFRSRYATLLYERTARKIKDIPSAEQYKMRNDRKGFILDRRAMKFVSQQLGHERIGIIASNYLDVNELKHIHK